MPQIPVEPLKPGAPVGVSFIDVGRAADGVAVAAEGRQGQVVGDDEQDVGLWPGCGKSGAAHKEGREREDSSPP